MDIACVALLFNERFKLGRLALGCGDRLSAYLSATGFVASSGVNESESTKKAMSAKG